MGGRVKDPKATPWHCHSLKTYGRDSTVELKYLLKKKKKFDVHFPCYFIHGLAFQ